MKSRTLTTIGLPIRLEVLIKSHLKLVNARTIDRWFFSDESHSDVAICAPDSPLSAIMVKRARETGSPFCISLIDSRQQPLPGTVALHDPLRVNDIIELLDRVSGEAKASIMIEAAASEKTRGVTPDVADHRARFAQALQTLMSAASRELHLIEAGAIRFCMLPVGRSIFLQEPPSEAWLDKILDVDQEISASVIPTARWPQVLSAFQHRASLITLLWHVGLNDIKAGSAFDERTVVSLSRWPDFGNLKHKPVHLRMAAELTRKRMTLAQLAKVAHAPIEQVIAFVNACALCNLINTSPLPASTAISAVEANSAAHPIDAEMVVPRRNLGFLHSIRMALGLRVA